jgi:multiple sugar transport system substrate-binding protein
MDSKRLSRRGFLQLAGATGSLVFLAACQAPIPGATSGSAGGAPTQERVKIEFLGMPGMPDAIPEEQARFHEEHPDVEWVLVEQQEGVQLLTLLAAGTPPDCSRIESNVYRTFVVEDVLVDITDFIDADPLFSAPDYWIQPQETDRCAVNGRWYGIGSCWVAPHIYYNLDLFEEVDIEPPSNDPEQAWSWNHFLEVARQMTIDANGNHPGSADFDINNVERWGVNWPTWWIPLHAAVQSNGGQWVDQNSQQIALDRPEATEALQRIADLMLVHQVMPQSTFLSALGMSGAQLLETKKVAMQVDGSWALSWLYQIEGTLGTAALPKMKRPATDMQAHLVCAVKGKTNLSQSWDLLRFLSSPWYQERYCNLGLWLPSQTSLMTDEAIARWCVEPIHPPGYQDIVTKYTVNYGHYLTMPIGYPKAVGTVLQPAFDSIWTGAKTAEEAMSVVPNANAVLAEEAARAKSS